LNTGEQWVSATFLGSYTPLVQVYRVNVRDCSVCGQRCCGGSRYSRGVRGGLGLRAGPGRRSPGAALEDNLSKGGAVIGGISRVGGLLDAWGGVIRVTKWRQMGRGEAPR